MWLENCHLLPREGPLPPAVLPFAHPYGSTHTDTHKSQRREEKGQAAGSLMDYFVIAIERKLSCWMCHNLTAPSRTMTLQPQMFPSPLLSFPLLQMLSFFTSTENSQKGRWWERCFRHILLLKAPGSVILLLFFPLNPAHRHTHTHIPTTSLLVLYLHTDPLG